MCRFFLIPCQHISLSINMYACVARTTYPQMLFNKYSSRSSASSSYKFLVELSSKLTEKTIDPLYLHTLTVSFISCVHLCGGWPRLFSQKLSSTSLVKLAKHLEIKKSGKKGSWNIPLYYSITLYI